MIYKLLVVFQFLLYHNIYANKIIFPISDPIYIIARQNFLQFHDLSIYKKHSSLTNQYLIKDTDNIVNHHLIDKHNVFFQLFCFESVEILSLQLMPHLRIIFFS